MVDSRLKVLLFPLFHTQLSNIQYFRQSCNISHASQVHLLVRAISVSAVAAYNEANGTDYELAPEELVAIGADPAIKAGRAVAVFDGKVEQLCQKMPEMVI